MWTGVGVGWSSYTVTHSSHLAVLIVEQWMMMTSLTRINRNQLRMRMLRDHGQAWLHEPA